MNERKKEGTEEGRKEGRKKEKKGRKNERKKKERKKTCNLPIPDDRVSVSRGRYVSTEIILRRTSIK